MNPTEARALPARIESLLDELAGADRAVADRAAELVQSLLSLYGAGLERITGILDDRQVRAIAADDLVGNLLVLHGLHPDDVDTRIGRALDRVRVYLGSHAGDVEYLGVDADGTAHLRLRGSCEGCPSSSVTVRTAIETAVLEAAPEVERLDVQGGGQTPTGAAIRTVDLPMPRIGRPADPGPAGPVWQEIDIDGDIEGDELDGARIVEGSLARRRIGDVPVLLARVGGNAYAYLDRCPECAAAVTDPVLSGSTVRCAGCGGVFDIALAGRRSGTGVALEPLPLLPSGTHWRVALPRMAHR